MNKITVSSLDNRVVAVATPLDDYDWSVVVSVDGHEAEVYCLLDLDEAGLVSHLSGMVRRFDLWEVAK